jgi:hypothetical protein
MRIGDGNLCLIIEQIITKLQASSLVKIITLPWQVDAFKIRFAIGRTRVLAVIHIDNVIQGAGIEQQGFVSRQTGDVTGEGQFGYQWPGDRPEQWIGMHIIPAPHWGKKLTGAPRQPGWMSVVQIKMLQCQFGITGIQPATVDAKGIFHFGLGKQ